MYFIYAIQIMSAGVVLKTGKIEGSIVFRRRDSEYLQVCTVCTGVYSVYMCVQVCTPPVLTYW